MESKELEDIHLLAINVFQNVTTLTPMLRTLVVNAKQYQKSYHGTCQLAQVFVDSLSALADAAKCAQGATSFVGEVLADIMQAYKELEGLKLELMKMFINEIIIPLESRAEIEISSVKSSLKGYTQENKVQTEMVEKATQEVIKIRKKTQRRKTKPGKYDDREKESAQVLQKEENKLKDIREKGLRTALIEERRVYCFVAERMCSFGRGMIAYNNRMTNFMNQKIPDWQAVIAKPTELPPESELLIKEPAKIDTATIRRKNEKRGTIKGRPPSTTKTETGTLPVGTAGLKYHTIDGRAGGVGSRPPLHRMPSSTPPVTPSSNPNSPSRFDYPDSSATLTPPRFIDEDEEKPVTTSERSTLSNSLRSALTEQLSQKLKQIHPQPSIELKAIYSHKGQDASQLSFTKGDIIIPVCEPTSGWQYGENKATGQAGWFPAAYVEKVTVDINSISGTGTLPARSSEFINRSVSAEEDKHKRYSTPNRKSPPVLPERDYDSDDSETTDRSVDSGVVNGHGRPVLGRTIPNSTSVPEMNIQYIERKESAKFRPLSPLATTMQNSIEDNIIPSPPPSDKSNDSQDQNEFMPPPPPPPFSPYGDTDESYGPDDGQSNPFANIRLKKTVTNDRSSPRVA